LKDDTFEAVIEALVEERMQSAYDEFLKNAIDPVIVVSEKPAEEPAYEASLATSHTKNELKVEPDTKNAHVWNELGNVYFNTGAYEEAISAYSKAIELDDWFAWPYSNLALVYVQKEKYAEAILLYQRSIELFASDQDKAITWNRLGNVYRRLNDYDNAIACYQRADELDPNNATRSLRSRFSLLGSLNIEASASLAV
jgi:tetratricopeptide (TPR) repeat protein